MKHRRFSALWLYLLNDNEQTEPFPMKTLILADRPGQMGNMLILYAHFLAFCKKNDLKLVNPAFRPYEEYFSLQSSAFDHQVKMSGLFRNYGISNLLLRLLRKSGFKSSLLRSFSIGHDTFYDLDEDMSIASSEYNLISGWLFRGQGTFKEHIIPIRDYFRLSPVYEARLDDYFKAYVLASNLIVGVHIRRGDYKDFEGGKHYHSNEVYASYMRLTKDYFKRPTTFLICSNEAICHEDFKGLETISGPGEAVTDMYALSRCDLVIGPPSTFTIWGQLMTDVPLFQLGTLDFQEFEQELTRVRLRKIEL